MERLALRKSLDFLLPKLQIVELATDASISIISMMGTYYICICPSWILILKSFFSARDHPEIFHSLDVWHKSKKLKKALEEVMLA